MNIRQIIDKAEKFCIIAIPIIYISIDFLSGFIPPLSNLIDEKGYLVVLSTLMVLIFLHLDRANSDESTIIRSKYFAADLSYLLSKKNSYNEVLIMAASGYQYRIAFAQSGVKVKKLKLLLRDIDNYDDILLPPGESEKKRLVNSTLYVLEQWMQLKKNGQVEELEISYYNFDTLLHFMILDDKHLFFGLLRPQKDFPGTDILKSYIVGNKFDLGEKMISDFKEKWYMVKEFSQDCQK